MEINSAPERERERERESKRVERAPRALNLNPELKIGDTRAPSKAIENVREFRATTSGRQQRAGERERESDNAKWETDPNITPRYFQRQLILFSSGVRCAHTHLFLPQSLVSASECDGIDWMNMSARLAANDSLSLSLSRFRAREKKHARQKRRKIGRGESHRSKSAF